MPSVAPDVWAETTNSSHRPIHPEMPSVAPDVWADATNSWFRARPSFEARRRLAEYKDRSVFNVQMWLTKCEEGSNGGRVRPVEERRREPIMPQIDHVCVDRDRGEVTKGAIILE